MSPPTEPLQAASEGRSPRLSAVFKGRRKKDKPGNESTTSLASTGSAPEEGSGFKATLDDALNKLKDKTLKDKTRSSHDYGRRGSIDSANSRRPSISLRAKLGIKKRRDQGAEEEDPADRGVDEDGNSLNLAPSDIRSTSDDSLILSKSVASSLLTEDSDVESPTISPHQSHVGYLTLSSPLIASQTVDSTASSVPTDVSLDNNSTLAPRDAKTLEAPSPQDSDQSPIGKLKEAFVPRRGSTASKLSEDTESTASAAGDGGGALGGLFSGVGKKNGTRSRRGSQPSLNPSPLGQAVEDTSSATKTPATPQPINTRIPATPPNLHTPPLTLVTPPTPIDARPSTPTSAASGKKPSISDLPSHRPSLSNPNVTTTPFSLMAAHRRARSANNPPSKLSSGITGTLTPTVEEAKTPGGSLTNPGSSGGGFFASVFSAAQNAANQFTNTIANNANSPAQRSRSGTGPEKNEVENTDSAGGEEVIPGPDSSASGEGSSIKRKPLAVETLGSGDLSLSHLGITDDPSPMSSRVDLTDNAVKTATMRSDEASAQAEDNAASQAVSAAYAADKSDTATDRPLSLVSDAATPPRGSDADGSTIKRSGSIRSRISTSRKRRHRGSSIATGNTLTSAINASNLTLAHPGANGHRLPTGFAVANTKRNRDFHQLFRSVPEDDYLVEDYSAALQRDILLQGRLYVSEGHICFSSNILGWVTNVVMSFDEVVSVEKKSTAVIFPNAIAIQTLHTKNVFASFIARDSTYDLIISIWKISHPNLKSSLNGVTLDNDGTGDKTEKAESVGTAGEGSEDGSDDEDVYDEDDQDEDEDMGSFADAASIAGSDVGEAIVKSVSRKTSTAAVGAPVSGGTAKVVDNVEAVVTGAAASADFPGPQTHAPTECGDEASHCDKPLTDVTIPAPLGKIYSLMFGPASGAFMRKWLVEDQKSTDLQMEDDKKGLGEEKKSFTFSYVKPLNAPIGPKATKCIVSETLEQFDLEKAVTVMCSTTTPDVPSGNVFVTKTRYCLMWGPNNSTRLIMNFTVEWSGKSWIKDGQTVYAAALVAALKAAVSTKAAAVANSAIKANPNASGARKGGKGRRRNPNGNTVPATTTTAPTSAQAKSSSWGPLEPLHAILGPVGDIIGPLFSAPIVIAVLSLLVAWLWFRGPGHAGAGGSLGLPGLATPQRIAAYEEMWRGEEALLWDWLEERAGLDAGVVAGMRQDAGGGAQKAKRLAEARGMRKKLVDERMSQREMEEAIRVTEERLEALKEAVASREDKKGAKLKRAGTV
ncbi:hypothetical protein H2199_006572 [Coniosporium tulheliwenetii]|uniref:Uncharacterized protein n=1 Tax=Coniosporium tulheliwenetii TaxID=3383036 RepID=A0ACC2YVV0_9PEZI|nr:hypothetical protein H2199_006572 [Cladosporium sp. JES 115]